MRFLYVGYFDSAESNEQRAYSAAAAAKMAYLAGTFSRLGHAVLIVSPSVTRLPSFSPGRTENLTPQIDLKLFASLPRGNKVLNVLGLLFSRTQLFGYLLVNTRRGQPIIVYHSLALQGVVLLSKAIRRFRLILQVEEIYQDVVAASVVSRKLEYRIFRKADALLFPTELLDDKLNTGRKPSAVFHGTYALVEIERKPRADGVTHVVYAGTFDPRKGGAAAAAAAAYLDASFHLHILGFGSPDQIRDIEQMVAEVQEGTTATITYDGVLSGTDFSKFLADCDIGLSTQDPSASFNDTSFPSKVLTYFAHGLKVVSIRIPAIERSQVASSITFYDTQDPETIATAIVRARDEPPPDPTLLQRLDERFVSDVSNLIAHFTEDDGS